MPPPTSPWPSTFEMRGDEDDLGRQHTEADLRGANELAPVEVGVLEEATQVVEDAVAAVLDGAERVHPVGVLGVHTGQRVDVTRLEAGQQRAQRAPDRVLIRLR